MIEHKEQVWSKSVPPVILKTNNQELVRGTGNMPAHVAVIKGREKGSYPNHWHSGMEIVYVKQGGLEIIAGGENYCLKSEQFLIIGNQVEHEIIKTDNNPGVVLAITFIEEKVKKLNTKIQTASIIIKNKEDKESDYLTSLLDKFYEMWESGEESYKNRKDYLIEEILWQTHVLLPDRRMGKSKTTETIDKTIKRIIEYLEQHHKEQISTKQIGDVAGYSREYFCRYFKEKTGVTVKQYLTELRLNYVATELLWSDETILSIALKHGFVNEKGFIAAFKRRFHILPSEFRMNMRKKYHKKEDEVSLKVRKITLFNNKM